MKQVSTFLMFQGKGAQALDLYASVFDAFNVTSTEKYGAEENGEEGQLKRATVDFNGHAVMIFDSPPVHDFDFTPSMSFFVDCDDEGELSDAFARLSEGGKVMMPLDDYGFSRKFGWLSDRFGVSWQLNLP